MSGSVTTRSTKGVYRSDYQAGYSTGTITAAGTVSTLLGYEWKEIMPGKRGGRPTIREPV